MSIEYADHDCCNGSLRISQPKRESEKESINLHFPCIFLKSGLYTALCREK